MDMKVLMFISVLLCGSFVYSQNVIVNDTSIVIGNIENAWIGKGTVSDCSLSSSIHIDSELVIVTGIRVCNTSNFFVEYYEIIYKNEPYLIERDNLKFKNDIDYFDIIQHFSSEVSEKFKKHAISVNSKIDEYKLSVIFKFIDRCKKQGVIIANWNLNDESEYTEGVGVDIQFYNPTNKTIKYIYVTLIGYNPVGDIVYKQGKSGVKIRVVGPLKPKESETYTFRYLWFTDLVVNAKISSLIVQYMDGTSKTIEKPKSVIMPSEYYEYIIKE